VRLSYSRICGNARVNKPSPISKYPKQILSVRFSQNVRVFIKPLFYPIAINAIRRFGHNFRRMERYFKLNKISLIEEINLEPFFFNKHIRFPNHALQFTDQAVINICIDVWKFQAIGLVILLAKKGEMIRSGGGCKKSINLF